MNKIKKHHQYPMDKVFVYYQLVANFIHALVLSLLNYILLKYNKEMPFSVMMVDNLFSFFIPFLCCTIYFVYKKYKIDDKSSLYHIAFLNGLIYIVYQMAFAMMLVIKNQFYVPKIWIFIIGLTVFVIVSTFCAKMILPKTERYLKNKYKREKMLARQKRNSQPDMQHIPTPDFNLDKITVHFKGVLSPTTMQNGKYPHTKVILAFLFYGGAVGGIVVATVSVVLLPMIIFAIMGGIILGTVPSVMTGIVLAYKKVCLVTRQDYFYVFLVGYITTFIYMIMPTDIFSESARGYGLYREYKSVGLMTYLFAIILANMIYALIGGVSAMIVGHYCLPKSKNNHLNF